MRTKLLSWIAVSVLAAVFAVAAHAQTGRVAGRIVAAKVKGTVTALNTADNSKQDLHDNDAITEKYVVTTAANSSVILVFSNGASVNLSADSTLAIEQFLQDPFSSSFSLANASEEPSTSVTKLNLTRGEMVGNVKHLHTDGSDPSSFTVKTPVGAAGIRGTTFRVVFRPDSAGKAFFTLSTAEGDVLLSGPVQSESVPTGKEVALTLDATVDANGNVVINSVPQFSTQDISAADQAAIARAAQEILAASAGIVFDSPTSSHNGGTPLDGSDLPPNAQRPQDDTTPGDGR